MSDQVLVAIIAAIATLAATGLSLLVRDRVRSPTRRAVGSALGIRITSPVNGTTVDGMVEVTGTYIALPPGTSLWLVNSVRNSSEYWPQVGHRIEVNKGNKTWRGGSWVGDDTRIIVVTAGRDAERLFRYYEKVGHSTGVWPGIDELLQWPDIVPQAEVWVRLNTG